MTPKRYQRLLRLERVIMLSGRESTPDWAAIPPDCGYADQSHMAHEFTALTSFSPTAWRCAVGPARAARDYSGAWYEGDLAIGSAWVAIGGGVSAPSGGYLIIGVPDADEVYERIRAAGVEVDGPQDKPYGPRTVTVTDPWGVTWDFWQGEAEL